MDENEKKNLRAAAISYDPGEHDAPVLAAFGQGHVAEKILAVAKESGIPIVPDPSLASMLSKISVGDEIPPELYEVVARVLTFVGEVDRSYGEKLKHIPRP
jgi:flagellar biosynthesis protein